MKQIANAHPLPSPVFDDDSLADIRAIAEPDRRNARRGTSGIAPKASRQSKTDTRGFRWQVRVWLDANKPDQLDLGRWIHELKRKRTFAPTVRNALSLYRELLIGETHMLYHLFPDLKPTPPPVPPQEIEKMKKKIDELQDRVNSLTDIVIKQNAPGASDMSVKMAGQGSPKPLQPVGAPKMLTNNKPAPPPAYDDDDDLLTIRKSETAGMQSQINFIKSAFALNGLTYDEKQ